MKKIGLILLVVVSGCNFRSPNPDKVQQNLIGDKKLVSDSSESMLKLYKLFDVDYGVVLYLKEAALTRSSVPAFSAQKISPSKIIPKQGTALIYLGDENESLLPIFRYVDLESKTVTYYTEFSPPVTVKLD